MNMKVKKSENGGLGDGNMKWSEARKQLSRRQV
jgi:hypothetical protein